MRRVSWNVKYTQCIYSHFVTPRMRRVSWNPIAVHIASSHSVTPRMRQLKSRFWRSITYARRVTSRMRRVSWNDEKGRIKQGRISSRLAWGVWVEMPRYKVGDTGKVVTSRMRRVSWNWRFVLHISAEVGHVSHEACELKWRLWMNFWICSSVTSRMRRVSWNRYQSE